MELKPFAKEDWYAFSGCESENPFICYKGQWTFILDENVAVAYEELKDNASAYLHSYNNDRGFNTKEWSIEFDNPYVTRAVLESISSDWSGPRVEEQLLRLGFKKEVT